RAPAMSSRSASRLPTVRPRKSLPASSIGSSPKSWRNISIWSSARCCCPCISSPAKYKPITVLTWSAATCPMAPRRSKSRMNLRSRISKLLGLILLLAGGLQSTARAHFPLPPKQLSEIGRRVVKTAVPDFKLTDQDGKPFRFADSRGKLVLITFIFTTCPDVCPLLTAKFAAIQRALDEQNVRAYRLLSITTDPE